MLKKIPSILSPELLRTMMEMGHGDELVLAEGSFLVGSHGPERARAAHTTVTTGEKALFAKIILK